MTFSRRSSDTDSSRQRTNDDPERGVKEGFVTSSLQFARDDEPYVRVASRHNNRELRVFVPQHTVRDTSVPREGERVYYTHLIDDKAVLVGRHADKHFPYEKQRRVAHEHSAAALTFDESGHTSLTATVSLDGTIVKDIDGSFTLSEISAITLADDEEQTPVTVESIEVEATAYLNLDSGATLSSNRTGSVSAEAITFLNTSDRAYYLANIDLIHAGGTYDVDQLSTVTLRDHKQNAATVELTNSAVGTLKSRVDTEQGDNYDSTVEVDQATGQLRSRLVDSAGNQYYADATADERFLTLRSYENEGGVERETTVDQYGGNWYLATSKTDKDDAWLTIEDGDVTLETEEDGTPSCTVEVSDETINFETKDGAMVDFENENGITLETMDGDVVELTNGNGISVTTKDGMTVDISNNSVTVNSGTNPVVTDITTETDSDGHVTDVSTVTSDNVLVN